MQGPLPRVLELWAGTEPRLLDSSEAASASGARVLFSAAPSRRLHQELLACGYGHIYSFVAIPSLKRPRWLLPNSSRRTLLEATRIYQPHRRLARMAKQFMITATKLGWTGAGASRLVVACQSTLTLSELVTAITGEVEPVFALSLGRQAAVGKVTMQVMRASGETLGYIKTPLTARAIERVRNEARALERLSAFPALRGHMPRLLYGGLWNNTELLFQSGLAGACGPIRLTSMHERFLSALSDAYVVHIPGQRIVDAAFERWRTIAGQLSSDWSTLSSEVLQHSHRILDGETVRCGVVHGDFAPWNTRIQEEKLLMFDWESATWDAPTSWDMFHFQIQTSYFLKQNPSLQPPAAGYTNIMLMLYLLRGVAQYLEEGNYGVVNHYKTLLAEALTRSRSEMLPAGPLAN